MPHPLPPLPHHPPPPRPACPPLPRPAPHARPRGSAPALALAHATSNATQDVQGALAKMRAAEALPDAPQAELSAARSEMLAALGALEAGMERSYRRLDGLAGLLEDVRNVRAGKVRLQSCVEKQSYVQHHVPTALTRVQWYVSPPSHPNTTAAVPCRP